ncbi:Ribosomal protein L30, bacterial-type [Penicillium griseofulvum]|uniref:Large ribosomal subunit protein uL30m n=1 Tax=Penicillium patulum TaxID=5078 RepID=A0A135LGB2_PENPA|nr:Ribosomal protein L30, bacterial-type [Penicillium griseofulvum]KXG47989.1 Ribosomal protein L30, bacterial-type [Penicillium griseofulvum]
MPIVVATVIGSRQNIHVTHRLLIEFAGSRSSTSPRRYSARLQDQLCYRYRLQILIRRYSGILLYPPQSIPHIPSPIPRLRTTSNPYRRKNNIRISDPSQSQSNMSYFRITLIRSAIGLPRRSTDVLKALGLKKRMATVFHAVSPSVAGQIMKVKELVQVEECQYRLTKQEVHLERKPDPGYYTEKSCSEQRNELRS